MKATFEDGRQAQFQEMMAQLTQLQSKYKGVRGELLAKVREELERCKPVAGMPAMPVQEISVPAIRVASESANKMLPSCRKCGRTMRVNDADGGLICDKGHTRPPVTAQAEAPSASL